LTRVIYFAAAALDGRIAGPDDDLTFLQTLAGEGDSPVAQFLAGVDGLVMGADTFRVVSRHETWPYGQKPTWVVTHGDGLPDVEGARIEAFAGDVRWLVQRLDDRGLGRTWLLGGGKLAAQFLAADLLDEVIVAIAPTFVGEGPALADGAFPLRRFRLLDVQRFEGADAVVLRYERARDGAG
jgi:dihydrofolate reductase